MPKKPAGKDEGDTEFEESLQKMVKLGTAVLNTPKPGPEKPVLHKKKTKTEPPTEKPTAAKKQRRKVKG